MNILASAIKKWQQAYASDQTASSFTNPAIVQATEVTFKATAGRHVTRINEEKKQNMSVMFLPYGNGADNNTFSIRFFGWNYLDDDGGGNPWWVPTRLFQVTCTVSAYQGITNFPPGTSVRFADQITIDTTSQNNIGAQVSSAADDAPGHILFDPKGAEYWTPVFSTGGIITNCNGLWRYL